MGQQVPRYLHLPPTREPGAAGKFISRQEDGATGDSLEGGKEGGNGGEGREEKERKKE